MATYRRITRKEMKRDEFVTAMGQFSQWMEDHVREVLIGGAVAAAAIVGGLFLVQYMDQREEKASALLGRGIDILHTTPGAKGSPGTYATEQAKLEAALSQMDTIVQSYPRSNSGRLALYYRGVALQQLGRTDEALKALGDFVDSNSGSYAVPMARAAMAHAYEAKGEGDKALAIYDQLSGAGDSTYPPQAALSDKARCLEGMGKKDEARQAYERLVKEYPDSDYARDAQDRLKEIS